MLVVLCWISQILDIIYKVESFFICLVALARNNYFINFRVLLVISPCSQYIGSVAVDDFITQILISSGKNVCEINTPLNATCIYRKTEVCKGNLIFHPKHTLWVHVYTQCMFSK